jgi:hypothetical protein
MGIQAAEVKTEYGSEEEEETLPPEDNEKKEND